MRFFNSTQTGQVHYDIGELKSLSNEDDNFLREMIELFINNSNEYLKNSEKAIILQDYKELGRLAHKILPSIRSLKIHSIIVELNFIENEVKAINPNYNLINNAFLKVKYVIEEVSYQLKRNIS